MERTIIHVDMDAFFAAVEQNDHPEYAGKPLVVGARPDKRGVVAASSYEAREFGIYSAMPSREAARRCPDAIFVPPNMSRYKEISQQIFTILERFTPYMEPLSIDEAFLDVTGALRNIGTGPQIAVQIRERIKADTGLTASVGVAPNKFLAKLASDLEKPDGLTVIHGDQEEIEAFLAPLPVGRIWGVGKVTGATLEKSGIFTIGQLQQAKSDVLDRIVGSRSAAHLASLAVGHDTREIEMDKEQKSFSREHTFGQDCTNQEELARMLCSLVENVATQLRAAEKYGTTANLKLRSSDFKTITRQKQFPYPCSDDESLKETAMELFMSQTIAKPVRLIGFGVSNLVTDRPPEQMGLFETGSRSRIKRESLSRTIDELRDKFGTDSITTASADLRPHS